MRRRRTRRCGCPRVTYVARQLTKSLRTVVDEARQGDGASVLVLLFLALSALYALVWCSSFAVALHRVAGQDVNGLPMPLDAVEIQQRIAQYAQRNGIAAATRERDERERVWQWPWNRSALDPSDRATQLRAVTSELELARTSERLATVIRAARPLLAPGIESINASERAARFWAFAAELERREALRAALAEGIDDDARAGSLSAEAVHAQGERRAAAHCLRTRYKLGLERSSGLLIVLLGSVTPPARRHDVRRNDSVVSIDEVRGVCEWGSDSLRAEGTALLDLVTNSSWLAAASALRARRVAAVKEARRANTTAAEDPTLGAPLPTEEELLVWSMDWQLLSPLAQLLFASGKLNPAEAARFTPAQIRVSASMELAAVSKAPHAVGMHELNNMSVAALEARAAGAVEAADSIFERYVLYRQNISALCNAQQPRDVVIRRFLAAVSRTDVLMKTCRSINQAFRLELLKRSASKINVWSIPKISDPDELAELCAFYALPPLRRLLAASGVKHELIKTLDDLRNSAIDSASKVSAALGAAMRGNQRAGCARARATDARASMHRAPKKNTWRAHIRSFTIAPLTHHHNSH